MPAAFTDRIIIMNDPTKKNNFLVILGRADSPRATVSVTAQELREFRAVIDEVLRKYARERGRLRAKKVKK